jgi:MptA/FolE2 family GTP cyclohydrolase
MNAPDSFFLPDIQGSRDHRSIAINRVGVKSVLHPVRVRGADDEVQGTVASIDMYVGLGAAEKGTHMSRFIEVLIGHDAALDARSFRQLIGQMLSRLQARSGYVEVRFPFFLRKRAPVSGVESLLDYQVAFQGEVDASGRYRFRLRVCEPVTSLCPCSREISEYGAHNQRSLISIRVEPEGDLAIEELVRIAEEAASCELFGLLKRPDEKWVTERAYDNPKFVEDLVRDIALRLDHDQRVRGYSIESENFESIHNHSAYALIERDKPLRLAESPAGQRLAGEQGARVPPGTTPERNMAG